MLSIAFVLAIVTSAVPKSTLFAVFSGLARGLSEHKLDPFIANMHVALWVLAATSLLGAGVCLMRPRHPAPRPRGGGHTLEHGDRLNRTNDRPTATVTASARKFRYHSCCLPRPV